MPNQPSNDILKPRHITIPNMTTTNIELMVAEVGTLVYDITKSKLSVCISSATGAAAWEDVTSA